MVGSFEFDAVVRVGSGKGDARRTRRANKVPAILYGGAADPVQLVLDHNEVVKSLANEAVYSHVLTVKYDGKQEQAILKGLQRHPSRPLIMHMDFQRVSKSDKLRVRVPLHFVNQEASVGVKKGGVVTHNMVELEVVCLPQHLPEFIEVDLAEVDIGQSVHLSDLKVPAGVEIHALIHGADHDRPIASIQGARSTEAAE
ncbi:MAG TPA: 50S ribosomal protein L25/general stress protein Ctc [Methylococcaceae bacterium]|jgi:large subunit ribosomal protein L25|nr:50S ribosomal protein L25/general stress protein Ctc [Methylococcaceae bacterium]